ncbi:beta-1,4-galactosyltransferase 3-like isoform X2 [Moschus berezovskii]|uniref:beta-1,4-galactosyltransferase 3-like isoform X2 n=1 Tax=Moschus berezovskii TaxID=68408 RepID=UPI0024445E14|nr:beta-1,4-galactosyltransferase 3-like isoform X2 [Moschus berezovskii]
MEGRFSRIVTFKGTSEGGRGQERRDRLCFSFCSCQTKTRSGAQDKICFPSSSSCSMAIDKFNYRLQLGRMLLLRLHLLFGRYQMLEEGQDSSHEQSSQSPSSPGQKWWHDAANSPGYRLFSKELQPLYTNLTMDIAPLLPEAPRLRGIWSPERIPETRAAGQPLNHPA